MKTKIVGNLGEKIAQRYLAKKGYKILAKNYIPKWSGFAKREIDLIAEKEKTIFFFEVKTLKDGNFFSPEEKVNFEKKRKIIKAAESYLLEKKIPLDCKWQIDVIAIKLDFLKKRAKIYHFENI